MIKTPQLIACDYTVPLYELENFNRWHRSDIIDRIHRQVSVQLGNDFVTERDDTHTRTYEFKAYVVTPNDLERMIEEGIQKRTMGYPRSYS